MIDRQRGKMSLPHAAEGGNRLSAYGDALSRYGPYVLLLVVTAALSCTNQLFLKSGVTQGGPIPVSLDGLVMLIRRIFTTPLILIGYAVGAVTNLVWLASLSRFEMSFAAPVLASLTFVFLLGASALVLGESVGANRWLGTLLIVAGMFLVGRK